MALSEVDNKIPSNRASNNKKHASAHAPGDHSTHHPDLQLLSTPSLKARLLAKQLVSALEADPPSWGKVSKLLKFIQLTTNAATQSLIVNAARINQGASALHLMARAAAPAELYRLALQMGAHPSRQAIEVATSHGVVRQASPLLVAAISLNVTGFREILRASPELNQLDADGNTLLNLLIRNLHQQPKYRSFVEELINAGSNPSQPTADGGCPLSFALRLREWELAYQLRGKGGSLKGTSEVEREAVATALAESIFEALDSKDTSLIHERFETLSQFEKQLGPETLRVIVNSRQGDDGPTILHRTALNPELASYIPRLVAQGADIHAVARMEFEISDVKETRSGVTALHLAVIGANPEGVNSLVVNKANVHARDSRGETPLFMLSLSNPSVPTKPIVDTLVGSGAQVNELNNEGVTCSTLCLRLLRWAAVCALGHHGAATKGLSDSDIDQLSEKLPLHLSALVSGKKWHTIIELFQAICLTIEERREGFLEVLLNRSYLKNDPATLFLLFCRSGAPSRLIRESVELGADTARTSNIDFFLRRETGEGSRDTPIPTSAVAPHIGANALHLAIRSGCYDTVKGVLDLGLAPNSQDALGNTALMYAMTAPSTVERGLIIAELLARGAKLNIKNRADKDALLLAYDRHDASFIKHLADALQGMSKLPSHVPAVLAADLAAYSEAFTQLVNLDSNAKTPLRVGARALFVKSRDPKLSLLYHEAYLEAMQRPEFGSDGWKLAKLMPHLLTQHPRKLIEPWVYGIEFDIPSDSDGLPQGYHPNMAELMAMLNHPEDLLRQSPYVDRITSSLTSITRLVQIRREVSGRAAANWGQSGTLSLSFLRWRVDAESILEPVEGGGTKLLRRPLMEQYGFTRIPESPTDSMYGHHGYEIIAGSKPFKFWAALPGRRFQLTEFDPQAYAMMRRGYIAISLPRFGSLLIRNSSPKFGRNQLLHPVYYSPRAVGKNMAQEDLLEFGAEATGNLRELGFSSLISRGTYLRDPDVDNKVAALLLHLRGLFQDYGAWKFDTRYFEAWQTVEGVGTILKGGHLSPGFKEVVAHLETLSALARKYPGRYSVPDLAFMHPDLTPWSTFGYQRHGVQVARLRSTPDVIAVLKKMAHGDYAESDLARTGIRDFFQQAGFNSGGELIFIRGEP